MLQVVHTPGLMTAIVSRISGGRPAKDILPAFICIGELALYNQTISALKSAPFDAAEVLMAAAANETSSVTVWPLQALQQLLVHDRKLARRVARSEVLVAATVARLGAEEEDRNEFWWLGQVREDAKGSLHGCRFAVCAMRHLAAFLSFRPFLLFVVGGPLYLYSTLLHSTLLCSDLI